jgi:transcriptional regulator with XRE-family HTH domain
MYIPAMSIGSRLDEAMSRAGFKSQSALARACGISQPTVNRILKGVGKDSPDTATLKKLAAATSVSFEWLSEGKLGEVKDNDIAHIVRLLNKLDSRNRVLIRGKIEAWIEMMLDNEKIPEPDSGGQPNFARRTGT